MLAPVVGDEDPELRHLLRPRAGRRERAPDIGKHLPRLRRHVPGPDEIALRILGDLAGDEHEPGAGGDDDVGEGLGRGDVGGIDALK